MLCKEHAKPTIKQLLDEFKAKSERPAEKKHYASWNKPCTKLAGDVNMNKTRSLAQRIF